MACPARKMYSIFIRNGCQFWRNSLFNRAGLGHTHTVNAVLDMLYKNFATQCCFPEEFGFGWSWPPYSPDLNTSDYFLWGFIIDFTKTICTQLKNLYFGSRE
jgi:hypothetical protein